MRKNKNKKIGENCDREIIKKFSALCDPTRLKIFCLLAKNKNICPKDITPAVKISPPIASYHLKKLESADLVVSQRKGQNVCYQINSKDIAVKKLLKIIG